MRLVDSPSTIASGGSITPLTRRMAAVLLAGVLQPMQPAISGSTVKMEGLRGEGKATTLYPDFSQSDTGLQFKDYKLGTGEAPAAGDRVLVEW